MPATARPINEITGIKKRSSVLVRGMSHEELAVLYGALAADHTQEQYLAYAMGPRGYSTYELWTQIPGNEGKTEEEFFDFLGFTEAAQEASIIAAIDAAQAAAAASALAADASADAALVSQNAAAASAVAADASADAALASENAAAASAAAAAASAASFNAAVAADIWTQTNITKFATAKALSDAMAWVVAAGGEITTPGGVRTVTYDMKTGFNRKDTLTANTTYAKPTNMVDGQTYQWMFLEDGTGGRTITLNAVWVAGDTALSFITTANAYTVVSGTYNAALDKIIGCRSWKSA